MLRGGHPRAEGRLEVAEGYYNGWPTTLVGPPSRKEEERVEQPTETQLAGKLQGKHNSILEKDW